MSQDYGIESQHTPSGTPHRPPARYLVVIESAGTMVAKLFLENRDEVAEIDAGSEEVAQMTKGLVARQDGNDPVWDNALGASSAGERRRADIYTLDV